jgi:VPDSG-CTERM motif
MVSRWERRSVVRIFRRRAGLIIEDMKFTTLAGQFGTQIFRCRRSSHPAPFASYGLLPRRPSLQIFYGAGKPVSSYDLYPVAGQSGFEPAPGTLPVTRQILSAPDAGSSVLLLGVALCGIGLLRRKLCLNC